jgi:hypothetical protein
MQQLQSFRLPPETLDIVLTYLQKPDLVAVACTSSLLRSLVIRHLYKRLIGVRGKRLIQCLLALLRYDTGIIHVHELEIVLPGKMNFLQPILLLIHRVLIRLTNLRTLSFEFSPENVNDSLGWVLKGCTFSLYSLETSLPSGPALSAFLCTQTELKNLCLRGICRGVSFPLPLSAMPRLTSFRILDASPSVIRTIVMGRPVTRVTVSLATDQSMPIFSELRRSARPLERLTLMTLSVPDPATLISDVASCFPNLDSLHIYALLLPFEEVSAYFIFPSYSVI